MSVRGALGAIYRNLPNAASILGVAPLALVFSENGRSLLPALIVYNNFMDDLDGTLARELGLRSDFGGTLDNLCDTAAHILLALAVGACYGNAALAAASVAAAAILVRMTTRITLGVRAVNGSTTNELMRHLLFLVLLDRGQHVEVSTLVIVTLLAHSVTMVVPFPMPWLLRTLAKTTVPILLINVALVAAWLRPEAILPVAIPFWASYLHARRERRALRSRAGCRVRSSRHLAEEAGEARDEPDQGGDEPGA
jgi:phosphatidylglycerophosphate synthase